MYRNARLVLGLGLATILGGCSSEPPHYTVSGAVTIDGKPAPMVVVRFVAPEKDAAAGATATTDDQGKFKLGKTEQNTGLTAGEFKVTFSQTTVGGKVTLGGSGGKKEEKLPTEKELMPEEYRDPEKTPFTAKVVSGENTFTFDLKLKK
jgi:hypothetical protein